MKNIAKIMLSIILIFGLIINIIWFNIDGLMFTIILGNTIAIIDIQDHLYKK